MVFSSLIFLWIFLPVVFILYFTAKEQYRNVILLIASLFFYAWGEPVYVFVMILSIVINYFCGLKIGVEDEHKRKRALFWGVFVNLALLGVFKYTGFFTENVNAVFGLQVEVKHLPLPIGISFYTFQSISYLVDIYRRVCEPQKNLVKMGLFISFFPQLIAGPILKYYDIASQIDKRQVTLPLFNEGAIRFLQGLAKKVIIANIMAKTADEIFALGINDISTPTAWIGIIAYTFQIYFDFSGYSDMAIGLGKMFGFHIHENFNHPYTATSIKDFWRRWHISLSTWFKEYLYIPLGGNREGTLRDMDMEAGAKEWTYEVGYREKLNSACAADERNELISVCRTPGTGNPQKLLVWTDSFAAALQPYLNKSFGTVFYSTAGLKKLSEIEKIVDETKPDLVVDELVERYFSRFANYPRIFGGEYD